MNPADAAYEILPRSRFRRVAARRLRASVVEKPAVTLHRTVDATAVVDLVGRLREAAPDDARPSLTSVLAVLLAEALACDPVMNSHVDGDEVRRFPLVHLAVAVATDGGLVAPVLRPQDLVDHVRAARRLAEVAETARAGRLRFEDLTPATFTMTSLGAWDIEYFTPILNPPQVGILGVGAVKAVERGANGLGHELPLSLTFDHAAVDGIDGARFLGSLSKIFGDRGTVASASRTTG